MLSHRAHGGSPRFHTLYYAVKGGASEGQVEGNCSFELLKSE